jgi:hypothetical protein
MLKKLSIVFALLLVLGCGSVGFAQNSNGSGSGGPKMGGGTHHSRRRHHRRRRARRHVRRHSASPKNINSH